MWRLALKYLGLNGHACALVDGFYIIVSSESTFNHYSPNASSYWRGRLFFLKRKFQNNSRLPKMEITVRHSHSQLKSALHPRGHPIIHTQTRKVPHKAVDDPESAEPAWTLAK